MPGGRAEDRIGQQNLQIGPLGLSLFSPAGGAVVIRMQPVSEQRSPARCSLLLREEVVQPVKQPRSEWRNPQTSHEISRNSDFSRNLAFLIFCYLLPVTDDELLLSPKLQIERWYVAARVCGGICLKLRVKVRDSHGS